MNKMKVFHGTIQGTKNLEATVNEFLSDDKIELVKTNMVSHGSLYLILIFYKEVEKQIKKVAKKSNQKES